MRLAPAPQIPEDALGSAGVEHGRRANTDQARSGEQILERVGRGSDAAHADIRVTDDYGKQVRLEAQALDPLRRWLGDS